MDTVLGEYSSISGNIESEGSIKILGKVEGDIKAGGDVYIEATSSITGNVYGSNVYVSGTIKGNVLSKGILHLMTQARLYGDIEIGSIVTDEGAIFQGNCRMIEVTEESEKPTNNIKKNKNKLKTKNKKLDD
ncbi:MAG: polymer-forming cytoskeletal protein [Clostridiaceae bacterium]|nr:polymer-forming cytoskeletal protein [Clostridiaceae bacterium]